MATAPPYVSGSSLAWGLRETTPLPIPSGISSGDIAIVVIATLASGTEVLSTPPDGSWTELDISPISPAVFSSTIVRVQLWWHVVTGAESGTWTFGQNAPVSTTATQAISGVWSDGDPVDPFDVTPSFAVGTTSVSTGLATAPSLTTLTEQDVLAFIGWSWDGVASTPPANFTERVDAGMYLADSPFVSPGPTGDISHVAGNSNGAGKPWAAILLALKPIPDGSELSPLIADSLGISDTATAQTLSFGYLQNDSASLQDTVSNVKSLARTNPETLGVTDQVSVEFSSPQSDNLLVGDTTVQAVKLGAVSVQALYIGSAQVWP